MRQKFSLEIKVPEGFEAEFHDEVLRIKKGEQTLERQIGLDKADVKIEGDSIKLIRDKANKKNIAIVKSIAAHINNMIRGLGNQYVYTLEVCNVHFPMTVRVDKDKLLINNFLGEKINRVANILSDVEVEIKGNRITVSSRDIEKAGQTAANIEKAAKVSKKDRRVFQDGIFIVEKPGAIYG